MRPMSSPRRVSDHHAGMLAAAGAAFVYGAAYPATAVALRSFSPLAIAGWSCTLALVLVVGLARRRAHRAAGDRWPGPRPPGSAGRRSPSSAAPGFIAGVNIAVALSGPTITGFVAPLYAVLATLFAVPILGEPSGPSRSPRSCSPCAAPRCWRERCRSARRSPESLMALAGAAMFGLYLVLARRWAGPYRLDGTLVTIANLLARGPAPARGRGRDRSATRSSRRASTRPPILALDLDRHRLEQHGQPAGDGQRPPGARRADVRCPAADAGRVGADRGGRPGRTPATQRAARGRPDPGRDRRGERAGPTRTVRA